MWHSQQKRKMRERERERVLFLLKMYSKPLLKNFNLLVDHIILHFGPAMNS